MSNFKKKNYDKFKGTGKHEPYTEKKKNQATETAFERAHMSDLTKASNQLL